MNNITTCENAFLREKYYSFTHSSGLPVYVFPKKLTTSYAIFATRYGSIDSRFKLGGDKDFTDVPDGIAHYLEHKLFEMPDGSDAFARFAKFGGNANAYTSNTLTAYLFSCTSSFEENLEILLDFVTTPYFTDATVEKERGIIAQEIRMYEDHPGSRLIQLLLEGMYEQHNIRKNIAGTVESIAKITPEILYECCRVFYNPSNMALIVSGDHTCEQVNAICDKILGAKSPSSGMKILRDNPVESPAVYKSRLSQKMQVSKPLFAIGIKNADIPATPEERMRRSAALSILNDLLFDKTTDFYNDLYTEGLISGGFDYGSESHESFAFSLLVGESSEPETVFERFKARIADAKKNGFEPEDFERTRRARYAASVKGFDSTEEIANTLLGCVFSDCGIFDYTSVLPEITQDELMSLLELLYKDEYYTLAVIEPMN